MQPPKHIMHTPLSRYSQPHPSGAHSPDGALAQAFAPFRPFIDQWVEEKFQQLMALTPQPPQVIAAEDAVMTRAELKSELNICDQTASNWEKQGLLISHRLGRRVFYKRAEVLAAMQSQARPDGTRRNARRGQKQNPR